MHGAGGVGGDELHHHPFARALGAGAVPLRLRGGQHLPVPFGAQGKVEEAGSRDLHLIEVAALQLQVVHDGLGDGSGGHVEGLGPGHGEGGGVIPVAGVLGNLDGGLHLRPGGQDPRGGGLFIGGLGECGHLISGGLNHVCHRSHLVFVCLPVVGRDDLGPPQY